MSDPKLKEAMAEIFGVLKKHDIGGQVTLVSPSHSEFRCFIEPSWSVAFFEEVPSGVAVRFRAKKSEIPDKNERHERVEWTTHMLCQIRDLNAQNFMAFDSLIAELGKHFEIKHKPYSDYEPHKDQ